MNFETQKISTRFYILLTLIVFVISPRVYSKPFWTKKSSYIEGDNVYFVGLVTGAETKEEGRKEALDNARHEFFEFLGVNQFKGVPFVTQMTFEEKSKSKSGYDVYRLMYVSIESIKKLKANIWKKKGNYSDEEIIEAINKIKSSNGKDKLAALQLQIKLQPRHKLLVISHLKQSYPGWNPILINALKSVITSRDKKMITKHLEEKVSLIEFVLFYGWEKEVKKVLIEKTSISSGYLSGGWLKAVVNLRDKATYPALTKYFVNGWNRHSTYELIKGLPGIDLKEALPEAWENAYIKSSKLELDGLTPYLLQKGYFPALEYTVAELNNKKRRSYMGFDPKMQLNRYLDRNGSQEEVTQWWHKNKNKLKFNSNRKKFVVDL